MSISTILGVLFGLGLVVGSIAISTDNLASFISIPSMLIVVGGTLAASFIGFQARYVIQALKDIGALVKKETVNRNILTQETGKIIRWGFLVKKNGILALEREAKSAKDQDYYLNYGIDLVITGYTADEVRDMMQAAAGEMFGRAMVNADILKNMTAVAPAFGMIGTLIGLIIMLQNIGGDPNGLGAGLAVALLTTLYGVLFARMVFAPAATKASQKAGIQRFRNLLVCEGLAMLAEHRSPRYIQDRMNSFLDPEIHYSIDKKGGGGKDKKKKAA
ncbi:MAG: flagellar motor protein MotA [Rhodospirillaceae bacterium]|nr:flagellar motor protein MotA [Rhodospirillaceae bacterium]MAR78897.1 flagellar motor protein MotA [Rhodospirillaceae bacterium]|tara:strand:- start:810 stop:1634 length:825 start_codon:yes stop_codon:yes gene_type:complete